MAPTLHLRAETKPHEHRSALTPSVCKELIQQGFTVKVERCQQRFFNDSEFEAVGAELVPHGSWRTAPTDNFIVGLKELPENDESVLLHRHIFFGHCYKYQHGWKQLIKRFVDGKGQLLDMEFLMDEKGRRVAAFGFYAGFAGAAVGLDVWCHQQLSAVKIEASAFPPIEPFKNEEALIEHIKAKLAAVVAKKATKSLPKVHVMGALGRCGNGAVSFCRKAGIPEELIVQWDLNETKVGGPFPQILESDIFINCIYLSQPIPPFLDASTLKQGGILSVLVDVSCDITNPHNPLPIYSRATTFSDPVLRIHKSDRPADTLDIVAIDHLPTLLPREASDRFSNDLLPSFLALKEFETSRVWQDAVELFKKKALEAETSNL